MYRTQQPHPRIPGPPTTILGVPVAKGKDVAGELQAAICKACGFTEFYTKAPSEIPVDGKYIREEIGPQPDGPFR